MDIASKCIPYYTRLCVLDHEVTNGTLSLSCLCYDVICAWLSFIRISLNSQTFSRSKRRIFLTDELLLYCVSKKIQYQTCTSEKIFKWRQSYGLDRTIKSKSIQFRHNTATDSRLEIVQLIKCHNITNSCIIPK